MLRLVTLYDELLPLQLRPNVRGDPASSDHWRAERCSAVVGAMPCLTAAPTLFGFAWQTPSFLSSFPLSTSLLIGARQGFREHEDPKRLQLRGGEREGGRWTGAGGRRAMCTKNPRLLFVTRSAAAAAAAVVLSGPPGRHVHVNEHPMSGCARAAE